jgi:hypothetical protein
MCYDAARNYSGIGVFWQEDKARWHSEEQTARFEGADPGTEWRPEGAEQCAQPVLWGYQLLDFLGADVGHSQGCRGAQTFAHGFA